ncbi:hypothetical protein AB0C81_15115 [Streptomyces roseoverticillatus]|uniref:hypothetical protein n=1 Tax=Streptomyces roseoverticillatus TaxID=66429 RepID=UPI0034089A89
MFPRLPRGCRSQALLSQALLSQALLSQALLHAFLTLRVLFDRDADGRDVKRTFAACETPVRSCVRSAVLCHRVTE